MSEKIINFNQKEKENKKKRTIENDNNESYHEKKKIKLNSQVNEIDYDNLEKILKDDPLFFS